MPIRIIFNGREYGDPDEMSEDVRRDYARALAQFEDANKNGIPDVLENDGKNVIAVHQSSFTVNGKTFGDLESLPPWARQLYDQVTGSAPPQAVDELEFVGSVDPFEPTRDILTTIVRVLLVLSAFAIVILATAIFMTMSESEKSQGGRVYVVVVAIVLLIVVIERYFKMSRR